jgi:cystathionine gamma-synthase
VTKVRYPGFGAIISFEINGDAAAADKVCDYSQLITNATSLGGVESTWERRRRWPLESESVPENLIRLSVGCEHVDDIWNDINSALAKI